MKRYITIIGVFLCVSLNAQEIKVKSMELLLSDLSARTNPRMDANNEPCALVKVVIPSVEGMQFEGWVVGKVQYKPGEYQVYVPAGAKKIQFRHPDYAPGEIRFTLPIEGKCTYRVTLDVPTTATTYEDLIDIAREYSRNYRDHTESSYYLAAITAYDQAIGHNDCPQTERDEIFEERNRLAAIRKLTYFREKADTLVHKAEAEHGFTSEDTYKVLSGEYNIANKLVSQYPEIEGFKTIQQQVHDRLVQHPMAQEMITTTVTKQRQKITGRVSFRNEYAAVPFNTLSIYASPTSKINPRQSELIGNVKADGTFKIVVPDDMKYIYVDGEKKVAHFITPDMETIDIAL